MSNLANPSLRKICISLAAACWLAAAGCSPEPKSEALPSRYFQLDMDLKINNKNFPISYNWHYEQVVWGGESQFLLPLAANPNSAVWAWSSSAAKAFDKRLDAETFFSVYLPDIRWCDQDYRGAKPYDDPMVIIVRTVPNLVGIEAFDAQHDHSADYTVNVGSAVIRGLDGKMPDTLLPIEEKNLRHVANSLNLAYQIANAVVIPSAEVSWRKTSIKDYFRDARGIIVAPIPIHVLNKSNGWEDRRFFEVDQSVPDRNAWFELTRRHRVAMTKHGDVWLFPVPMDTHLAFVHFTIPYSLGIEGSNASSRPEANVEYEGTSI
jgi:hypothetical protein